MKRKKIIIGAILIVLLICVMCIIVIRNKKINYITDNEYLYDVAIDYLKEKYTQEDESNNKREDFQIFFDYKGFGISEKNNIKYAYMWIFEESYYVENGELKSGSGSSMPYKIKFKNNKVVDYEIPLDGSKYTSSIKKMFPDDIEKKILGYSIDSDNLRNKVNEHYSYLDSDEYIPTPATYEFVGEIIEAGEKYIIVKPDSNTIEKKSSDKILVNITRPTNGTNDFYVVGNKVKITYNGNIMETYPAQIIASKVELAD